MKTIPAMIGTDRHRCGAFVVRLAPQRWQHEYEMPDAVVHRRPQRDRGGERQQGGERDQEKNRAPVEGATPCEGRKQGAHRAAESQDRQDHRQLERE
jgi:hypothetical protein